MKDMIKRDIYILIDNFHDKRLELNHFIASPWTNDCIAVTLEYRE